MGATSQDNHGHICNSLSEWMHCYLKKNITVQLQFSHPEHLVEQDQRRVEHSCAGVCAEEELYLGGVGCQSQPDEGECDASHSRHGGQPEAQGPQSESIY